MTSARTFLGPVIGVIAGALILTACGSDDAEGGDTEATTTASATAANAVATQPSPTGTPTTAASDQATSTAGGPITVTDSIGTEVALDGPAEAIVSLSPSATESLFAIGAGDQVVAVDEYSYYPEEAPVTDLSGFTPNAEAVADYSPDLVVIQGDANDLVAQLTALDIPVLTQVAATTFDDVYAQITNLGDLTGNGDGATVLVEQMQTELDKLAADAPEFDEPVTYYHEVSTDHYTITSDSFAGQVYGLFGLTSIADDAGAAAGTEYPQMQAEAIVEADPDLVFLATASFGEDPETVAARPGWGDMTAVTEDQVIALPPDVPSRWGPRIVDFAQVVADAVAPLGDR